MGEGLRNIILIINIFIKILKQLNPAYTLKPGIVPHLSKVYLPLIKNLVNNSRMESENEDSITIEVLV